MQRSKTKNTCSFCSLFFVLAVFFLSAREASAQIIDPRQEQTKEISDTTEIEDNPYKILRDTLIPPTDSARLKGLKDYKGYVMDKRYLAPGDSLNKPRWYRDLFLQVGMGIENMFPPTKGYKFNTLNTFHFGVGKQLGKHHSLRLLVNAALGYQQDYDRMYLRVGGQFDHLFNISSYLNGYNPSRLLEVGTVVGVGLHRARLRSTARVATPYEVHGGLQLRFYTGPHGVLNIEPYVALASDDIDLSQARNWHRYDVAYGVNANFVYYFDNHLSRAARNRLLKRSKEKDPNLLTADSTRLRSWMAPWLFEMAAGVTFTDNPELTGNEKMGYEWAVSGGKWFSPIIGLRASAMFSSTLWGKKTTKANQLTYEEQLSSFYVGARVEGMFNPLGFLRSFRWDAPVGFYIVGGAGLGWLMKHKDANSLHCWSESYSVGMHLWARLTDGLQFYIEPRYSNRIYNVPYRNVQWMANFSDNTFGVNAGVTVTSTSRPYRKYEVPKGEHRPRFAFGVGGGIHLLSGNSKFKGPSSIPYNANAFFEYRPGNVSGIRLAFEYMKHNTSDFTRYYDLNMNVPEYNYAPMVRKGLLNYTYNWGLTSLNYSVNLTNAFSGYRPGRLFDFEGFVGPSVMFTMSRKAVLDGQESLRVNHEMRPMPEAADKIGIAINGGVKLTANVYRGLGITLTPQLYYNPNLKVHGMLLGRLKVLGSLDLGLQYQF